LEEEVSAAGQKDLAGKAFGCILNDIHKATLAFANNRGFDYPWDKQRNCG
jgi:hypothetical protein